MAPAPRKRKPVKKKKTIPLQLKFAGIVVALILLSPLYYGYILKSFSSAWQWVSDIGEDTDYRTYESYGIKIPKKYTVHGIDVSYYQGKINWKEVSRMNDDGVKISFAFIKATEGLTRVDRYFSRNWREAPKVGIVCGAYHYFRPRKDGKAQAKFFLQVVNAEDGDLPPVVDIEELDDSTPEKMRGELAEFLDYVEVRSRQKPIIYTGLKFYQDYLEGYFDGYPLWIAHYYKSKLGISVNSNWLFWQHSDKAKVNGINHPVDFNVYRMDSTAFRQYLIR
ncbi:glycoside hydrolase family 25 protein [Pedobacter sp. HMF7647]|uniref:Glycoside hydrolase family 25 protein n=1 Tax=Hufsiella arboris TaxID=2695275 RepID=A0A7K1YC66_9SPHI|nr:glycoside hydrolase family 25 protein [Hufsiella arboris]MXV52192.1 glycoside hydrolase family 25 protein [Hufsiella arboris]